MEFLVARLSTLDSYATGSSLRAPSALRRFRRIAHFFEPSELPLNEREDARERLTLQLKATPGIKTKLFEKSRDGAARAL